MSHSDVSLAGEVEDRCSSVGIAVVGQEMAGYVEGWYLKKISM